MPIATRGVAPDFCRPPVSSRRCTSVRSSKSAKVRRRESHSGHSHPTNTESVSSRWASSLSHQSAEPDGGDRPAVPTSIPSSARPRLHPRMAGSIARLAIVTRAAPARINIDAHHHMTLRRYRQPDQRHRRHHRNSGQHVYREGGCANVPARQIIRRCFVDCRCGFGLFDQHRHLATWSSLEIRNLPSSCTIVTRRR